MADGEDGYGAGMQQQLIRNDHNAGSILAMTDSPAMVLSSGSVPRPFVQEVRGDVRGEGEVRMGMYEEDLLLQLTSSPAETTGLSKVKERTHTAF